MEVDISLVIAFTGIIIAIASFIIARTGDARKLEHRLTALEEKINPIWQAIISEIPNLLIKEDTPELDELLRMASNGLEDMTDKQIHKMLQLLNEEYTKAIEIGNSGRAVGIALFRATLKGRTT